MSQVNVMSSKVPSQRKVKVVSVQHTIAKKELEGLSESALKNLMVLAKQEILHRLVSTLLQEKLIDLSIINEVQEDCIKVGGRLLVVPPQDDTLKGKEIIMPANALVVPK